MGGHMKSILDPSFRYTASFNTDLSKTFARLKREEAEHVQTETKPPVKALFKASPISPDP
jgi:hypothetical protein